MSERLVNPAKQKGISSQAIRKWGLIFLLAGIIGKAILEAKILGIAGSDANAIYEVLESPGLFKVATVAIILQIVQTCAVPVFAFLLVEGVKHTKSLRMYFLRVLGLAVVSEIPYDLVYRSKWMDLGSQNPIFGLVVALIMLFLMKSYAGKGVISILIDIASVVGAILWVSMLQVDEGTPLILITVALWLSRKKKGAQVFAAAVVTCLCSTFSAGSLRYFFAPVACLLIHFYNEEPGEGNKIVNYAAYPAILMVCWLAAKFGF